MTGEADPGVTDSTAVDAGVSSRWVVSWDARLPPGSLLFGQVLNLLLSYFQLFLQHTSPSAAVSCCGLPALSANIQSFHVALADIFVAQLGSANRS